MAFVGLGILAYSKCSCPAGLFCEAVFCSFSANSLDKEGRHKLFKLSDACVFFLVYSRSWGYQLRQTHREVGKGGVGRLEVLGCDGLCGGGGGVGGLEAIWRHAIRSYTVSSRTGAAVRSICFSSSPPDCLLNPVPDWGGVSSDYDGVEFGRLHPDAALVKKSKSRLSC